MKPELFNSLKTYKKANIFKDLQAGLMVAIIAMPLSIALGIQSVPGEVSSHGIQMGLVTAIIAGFFISAFGGSRFQIGGPTAAFVVILFGYLSNPDIGLLGLAIAGVAAGVILIIMGLCRVGNVMKFFPYPIIIGFTTGIGITLMVGQIKDLCGFNSSGTDVIEKLVSYAQNITTFNWLTFVVGAVGLLCVIVLPKINKKIPSAFVALVVCTGLCALLNKFCGANIETIGSKYGDIKAGFFLPDFSQIANVKVGSLIVPSIVIAFLCAIESLLSASVASGLTNTPYNPNQELLGQGMANICSSLLGGLPATGAIARTVAGIENGAKSPLTGVFHSVFVLIMYFALMSVLKFVPLAVFSAILISVAINMSRFPLFFKMCKFGKRDVAVLIITCVLTVVFDLTYGVIGGIVLALLVNVQNLRIKLTVENSEEECPTLIVNGTLYFINVNKFIDVLNKEFELKNEVIVDLSGVKRIDSTSLEKIVKLNRAIKAQGKSLELVGYNDRIRARLDKYFKVF
ncbi:MAG: STAS domain-containing protein [Clostridia bacterium]|nr:STAS domain-containing protein [Clostridia bacterium]MDE6758121.1 STAS domain-containing protein [Clostridia bacterium]